MQYLCDIEQVILAAVRGEHGPLSLSKIAQRPNCMTTYMSMRL